MKTHSFLEAKFQKLAARLEKRLDGYLADPGDEEKLHDIRIAIRRLDSLYPLLDKKSRKQIKKKLTKYRELFKASSKVRDYDVMSSKLEALSSDACQLIDLIRSRKTAQVRPVFRKAKALRKSARIRVQVSDPESLERRMDKVVHKLCSRIRTNLSLTLSDSTRVDELHSLRKDFKRLRYILESLDGRAAERIQGLIREFTGFDVNAAGLQNLQDALGKIHDSDITLEFLANSQLAVAKEMHQKESATRAMLYHDFAKNVKSILAARHKEG
jgi:CHAD domain-containing protein